MKPDAIAAWTALERHMLELGLNVWLLRSRQQVEPAFAARAAAGKDTVGNDTVDNDTAGKNSAGKATEGEEPPSSISLLHPACKTIVLLGSAGREFWEQCLAARQGGEPDPMDRHTERVVEQAMDELRRADPTALAAYPFAHERQIVPFLALLEGTPLLRHTPFGVALHSRFGPWFAWRAALLTALPLPPTALEGPSPCEACPAPCVAACPVGAVKKTGFDWQTCVTHRVAEETCRETCLARMACPVAPQYRYSGEQMAYHYGISLRTILSEGWAKTENKKKGRRPS